MALEIEGKIIRMLNVQSGVSQRGEWSKQEFILEYQEGSYATNLCLNVWGPDKVRDLEKYKVGDRVRVSFNLSSREFNGRWYTDVRVWRIELAETAASGNYSSEFTPTHAEGSGSGDPLDSAEASSTGHGLSAQQLAPQDYSTDTNEDDLPF